MILIIKLKNTHKDNEVFNEGLIPLVVNKDFLLHL